MHHPIICYVVITREGRCSGHVMWAPVGLTQRRVSLHQSVHLSKGGQDYPSSSPQVMLLCNSVASTCPRDCFHTPPELLPTAFA